MGREIHSHLIEVSKKHCKPLQKLLQKNGVIEINVPKNFPLFDCLTQTVIEQQLAYAAAKTIWQRLNKAAASADQHYSNSAIKTTEQPLKKLACLEIKSKQFWVPDQQ